MQTASTEPRRTRFNVTQQRVAQRMVHRCNGLVPATPRVAGARVIYSNALALPCVDTTTQTQRSRRDPFVMEMQDDTHLDAGTMLAPATGCPSLQKQPHSIITKKTKKMVRVQQEYIDGLLARRPIKPFPFIPEERIQLQDPKKQERTRARQARIAALLKVIRDEEEDILEQYRVKGYAEMEVEVEDVDDEGGELA
ncbi:hypothetical protein HU200_040643 [Digitaria exilis]|uniref:Uncharacterized protein n=1 Tax=Digitaria exilis TaxID=1010633 RepID=A0A835BH19_9POAL|nr:hypothetical protein HU200_040643 [Digitaria exilis]